MKSTITQVLFFHKRYVYPSGRVCQYSNGFVKPVTIFEINAIYHIFQNSFCAHVSRVLTLQSGQQCSTPNLKQKNYASIYSLKVNTVTFLSSTVTVIFLGKSISDRDNM